MRSLLPPDMANDVFLEPCAESPFSIPAAWQNLTHTLPLFENDTCQTWPVVNLRYQRSDNNAVPTAMWHKKRRQAAEAEEFSNVLVIALELPGFHIENLRVRLTQVDRATYLFISGKEETQHGHYNFFFSYWVPTTKNVTKPFTKMKDGVAKIKHFW